MGAADRVDRVQLQQADIVDRTPQAPGVHPAVRPRSADALRSERDAARLSCAQHELGAGAHNQDHGVSGGVAEWRDFVGEDRSWGPPLCAVGSG